MDAGQETQKSEEVWWESEDEAEVWEAHCLDSSSMGSEGVVDRGEEYFNVKGRSGPHHVMGKRSAVGTCMFGTLSPGSA